MGLMQQAGGMDVNSLMQRLKRLATLDTTVFDEVKGDTNSTIPAPNSTVSVPPNSPVIVSRP